MSIKPPLDKEAIKNYVGLSSFQKGEGYATHQAIKLGKIKNNVVTALCQGHEFDPYKVEAIFDDRGIHQSYCSCPVGAGGRCKHIAALLLTWLDHPDNFADWKEIQNHLQTYDSQTLLELIDLLEDKVEGSTDVIHSFQKNLSYLQSPYLAKYLKRIEEAFRVSKLPWYHPDEAGATEIAFALEKIRSDAYRMIEEGHTSDALRIYQSLMQHILNYLDEHRDPWGTLGGEMKGCVEAFEHALVLLPSHSDLRQKIFQLLFRIIEEQVYREDDIGAEEARHIILEYAQPSERKQIISWVKAIKVMQTTEGEEIFWLKDFLIDLEKDSLDPEVYLSYYRQTAQLNKLVDSLLYLGRTQEVETAIKQMDWLSQPLSLASILLKYHQDDLAERLMVEAAQKRSDVDIFHWLKDFYLERGQQEKALNQLLEIMHISPQFSYYQELQEVAQPLGRWESVRKEILEFLQNLNYQSLLIEIYLDEKNLQHAIEAFNLMIMKTPRAFEDTNKFLLALRLAAAARHKFPSFAIQVYQEAIQDLIEERNRESYHKACDYLKVVRDIFKENQRMKEWNGYLKNMMQTYNRFKALKDEIYQAGLV